MRAFFAPMGAFAVGLALAVVLVAPNVRAAANDSAERSRRDFILKNYRFAAAAAIANSG